MTTSKKYYIQGMHCSACEILVKKEFLQVTGVEKAKVSLKNSEAVIEFQGDVSPVNLDQINTSLKESGYRVFEEKPQSQNGPLSERLVLAVVLAFAVFAFYVLNKAGILEKVSVTESSGYLVYFLFGVAAGFSSCAALVGGLLLSVSAGWKKSSPFLYFNLSRLVTFAFLGGILGLIGSRIQLSASFNAFINIAVALLMAVLALQMIGVKKLHALSFNFAKNISIFNSKNPVYNKYAPFLFGAVTFLVPCGFTLTAQSNALLSGSFANGALKMLAFALGTLPALALISFTGLKLHSNASLSKKVNLAAGVLILILALSILYSQIKIGALKTFFNRSGGSQEAISGQEQLIQLEAKGFAYFPKKVSIKSFTKTKLEIYDSGAVGCSRAVYAPGLYNKPILLKPGINSVEFVSPGPGTYQISCTMGMVDPVIVEVN